MPVMSAKRTAPVIAAHGTGTMVTGMYRSWHSRTGSSPGGNGGQSRSAHQNGDFPRRKAVPDSLPRGLRGGKNERFAEYMKNGGLPYITNFAGDSEKIDIRDRLCEARNKRAIPITRFNTGLIHNQFNI